MCLKKRFVYEGNFTNDAAWDILKRFKENGYSIHLLFFGLTDPRLSEMCAIERSVTVDFRGKNMTPKKGIHFSVGMIVNL